MINVTVWNENVHEKQDGIKDVMKPIHPNGLHETVADIVRELGDKVNVRTATLDQPEQGLPDEILDQTDVLIWWGHCAHDKVEDALVSRIQERVLKGMGLIVLHSGHYSKIFKRMMGTSCDLRWRDDTYERVFCISPNHPIAKGIPEHFDLGTEECYGERFDIPQPDEVILRVGLISVKYSAADASGTEDTEKYFTSSPVTKPIPLFRINMSDRSSKMQLNGLLLRYTEIHWALRTSIRRWKN